MINRLWIDMNEPANFGTNEDKPFNWPIDRNISEWTLKCPNNEFDTPEYLPLAARPFGERKRISDKSICMISRQGEITNEFNHYNVHNLYGWSQSEPTQQYKALFFENQIKIH